MQASSLIGIFMNLLTCLSCMFPSKGRWSIRKNGHRYVEEFQSLLSKLLRHIKCYVDTVFISRLASGTPMLT